MLSRGQGATMAEYDTLLLAFDMEKRVAEAESLWNMILLAHTRSLSKQLFSRMISLYAHHDMDDKIIEVDIHRSYHAQPVALVFLGTYSRLNMTLSQWFMSNLIK